MSHNYTIRYEVPAQTELEAIKKAAALLRSNYHLIAIVKAEPVAAGFWTVSMRVEEDEE